MSRFEGSGASLSAESAGSGDEDRIRQIRRDLRSQLSDLDVLIRRSERKLAEASRYRPDDISDEEKRLNKLQKQHRDLSERLDSANVSATTDDFDEWIDFDEALKDD